MSDPPRDRWEFWIRFICAFLFFGLVLGLFLIRSIDTANGSYLLAAWIALTLAISFSAARTGDEVWRDFLRWF